MNYLNIFNYKTKQNKKKPWRIIKKEEANENATIRHCEMVYVESVQEIILIPNDKFESSEVPKYHPSH